MTDDENRKNLRSDISLNIENKLCLQTDSGTNFSTSQPGCEGRKGVKRGRRALPAQCNHLTGKKLALLFYQTFLRNKKINTFNQVYLQLNKQQQTIRMVKVLKLLYMRKAFNMTRVANSPLLQ